MDSHTLVRQGHRVLQLGVALVRISSLEGLAIPAPPMPPWHLTAPCRIWRRVHKEALNEDRAE